MMIYRSYNDSQAASHWFGRCCGATYTHKVPKTVRSALKGIRVIDGLVGKESTGPKVDINHIKTRNGDFTLVIQHTPSR